MIGDEDEVEEIAGILNIVYLLCLYKPHAGSAMTRGAVCEACEARGKSEGREIDPTSDTAELNLVLGGLFGVDVHLIEAHLLACWRNTAISDIFLVEVCR